MSGSGPSSIPTSEDRRSKRPVKKRALTPVSAQAAELESLFAKPDQEIRLEPPKKKHTGPAPPPEIVTNVQGSSAGAGSGEFHVYKAARRREYERLRIMDEEVAREKAAEEFERSKREKIAADDEKTRRNREKREKMKARKKAKAAAKKGDGDGANGTNGAGASMNGVKVGGAGGGESANGGKAMSASQAGAGGKDVEDGLQPAAAASEMPGLIIHDED